ncbi:hypothetical protein ACT4R0_05090 [Ornithobacterium rhinotracheale]|uniref:hypothetical protein n=1 Tax=Ornithobacterium rhinotracheale TaxID=28251 RepID=UPI0040354220
MKVEVNKTERKITVNIEKGDVFSIQKFINTMNYTTAEEKGEIKAAMFGDEIDNKANADASNISETTKWKKKLEYLTAADIESKAEASDLTNAKEDLQEAIALKADETALQSTNSSVASIQRRVDIINQLLQVNDDTLDELQEIVTFIKQNKEDLQNLNVSNIAGLADALNNKLDREDARYKFLKEDGTALNLLYDKDLDDLVDSGLYVIRNNPNKAEKHHLPPMQKGFTYDYHKLIVLSEMGKGLFSKSVTQIIVPININTKMFYRIRGYRGNWSDWKEIITSDSREYFGLSQSNQTIESGVIREIDVQGRLDFKNLTEKEVSNTQFSKVLVLDNKGTLAQKDASNWQKTRLTSDYGQTQDFNEDDLNKFDRSKTGFFSVKKREVKNNPFPFGGGMLFSYGNATSATQFISSTMYEASFSTLYFRCNSNVWGYDRWRKITTEEDLGYFPPSHYGSYDQNKIVFKPIRTGGFASARYTGALIYGVNNSSHKTGSLSTFELDLEGAISGRKALINFNGDALPNIPQIKYSNKEAFQPNVELKIHLTYIDRNTILGTIYK